MAHPAGDPRSRTTFRALWRARPSTYTRRAWLATLALDFLPWPWGEELLAKLFVAKALVRPGRLRTALAWATHQQRTGWTRWRLALSCCSHHGRFVARRVLLGLRTPEDLGRHVVVTGGEHLANISTGAILIGFHLGPPGVAVSLRASGHRVMWMGRPRASRGWSREAWRRMQEPDDALALVTEAGSGGGGALYRARRLLLDCRTIYVAADGNRGREAFRLALPGGLVSIRSGWLVLRRQCVLPVLPVLTHLEHRTHVVDIHPPLPLPIADAAADLEICRETLTALLVPYVRRFPEQCTRLMLRARAGSGGSTAE